MALTDHKITDGDISTHGVQSAPDKLTGTAAENKAIFDKLIKNVVQECLNGLIDELVTALSGKMPAPENMGAEGQYMKSDGQGGVEWDTPEGSGDMLRAIYDGDMDGRVDSADAALTCTGNAATATKLQNAVSLLVQDASGTYSGAAVSFDGSGNAVLKLPATIAATIIGNVTGNVTGNAGTATRLHTARTFLVKNGDDNKGESVSFNGSGNAELPLPATLNTTLGTTKLNADSYGDALPAGGVEGQLFFLKKVSV